MVNMISPSIRAALATFTLGFNPPAFAQPINSQDASYLITDGPLYDILSNGEYCYNSVLDSITDGPSTAQLLAMFFEGFVEGADGKVYAVNNGPNGVDMSGEDDEYYAGGEAKGLYEVIPTDTA